MNLWFPKIWIIIRIIFLNRLYSQPRLFFSTNDVLALKEKAQRSHSEIFARITSAVTEMKRKPHQVIPPSRWEIFSRSWNEIYGNNLPCLAFYCLLNNTDLKAFGIAETAIKRFTSLPNWRCALNLDDDVPVAHSLVGMATAYDFLRHRFHAKQQEKIERKLINVTRELYNRSFYVWWGNAYIQNHVATNYVALLVGALALRGSTLEAEKWIQRTHLMLNRTMFLLGHVEDGSLEEGVAYGSYTTRSLTQYIFLAKRHLSIDHTNNPWLHQHFWFLYHTILPTFDKTIGVADSNGGWFFGPESQLVFLDSMVMRNGWGNWLANQINDARRVKNSFQQANAHRFATLHTEFLFHDGSLGRKAPCVNATTLHVFKDWGVVKYGTTLAPYSNTLKTESSSFLSFKCGVLHGSAINKIVKTRPWNWIEGLRNFNPGHEHPDHGSFTYYTNGLPFVTDALYGPKNTWLNNVVMFGTGDRFEGQIGEGGKWIGFKKMKNWKAKGTIITAIHQNDKVFIVGEYSKWYAKHLGIEKLYRNLILLKEDLLVVIDVVIRKPSSSVTEISAFFHNRFQEFQIHQHKTTTISYAELQNNASCHIHWLSSDDNNIRASKHKVKFKAEYGTRQSNLVNITSSVQNSITSIVYVFSGPNIKVMPVQVKVDDDRSTFVVDVNSERYKLAVLLRPDQNTTASKSLDDFVSITLTKTDIISFKILDNYLASTQGEILLMMFLIVTIIVIFNFFKILKFKQRLAIIIFIFFIMALYLCDVKLSY